MRLVSVTLAKNEADIIESFVRFNLQWFDHMVVLDHDSSDATPRILSALAAEGLPITVLHDRSLAFTQGPTTTRLARNACVQLGADFVFPLDADEFVKCESRSALESGLSRVPAGKLGSLAWQNYIVSDSDNGEEIDPAKRIRYRAAAETVPEQKVVLSRAVLTDPAWEVSPGNHFLASTRESNRVAAMHSLDTACIAHFPLRDTAQLQRKAILGWLSHRLQNPVDIASAESSKAVTQNWHLRAMFRDCLTTQAFGAAQLTEMAWKMYVAKDVNAAAPTAADFTLDPLRVSHNLRYTDASDSAALAALARWADRLLTRLGEGMV
jgi:Glycosyl transferase family 2